MAANGGGWYSLTQYDGETAADGRFLSTDDAARYLGVSRRTFERLAKANRLRRYRRPGDRRHYFEREELDRYRGFREIGLDGP